MSTSRSSPLAHKLYNGTRHLFALVRSCEHLLRIHNGDSEDNFRPAGHLDIQLSCSVK